MARVEKKRPAAVRGRRPEKKTKVAEARAAEPATTRAPAVEANELPFRWDEIPGLESAGEPDPQEVEATANQVVDNVLRRFGWARDERGHIEHVGDEREAPLKKAS